jgi:Predicted membrane protein (DUF2306)
MMRKAMRWTLVLAVCFLALIGVGASVAHYLQEPNNPGFIKFPTITALHVVLGGFYLALAPFQFVKRIRSRHLGYHRWAGRVLVAIGLVVGAAGVFMAMVIPAAGWPERVVVGSFGLLFLVALGKGFLYVRAGRVALHREWMIRAFAIALAIATTRLIFISGMLIVGMPTDGQVATLVIVSFTVAFVVHALLAEAWIRATRRSSVTGAGAARAA